MPEEGITSPGAGFAAVMSRHADTGNQAWILGNSSTYCLTVELPLQTPAFIF